MKVGLSIVFQNLGGRMSDAEMYAEQLALGDTAEDRGFDSIWTVEHHFTDYDVIPDPLQYLTYVAGRTKRIQLGTMVVVLPWDNPVRTAERVAVLDIVSGGRVVLGVGRGLGKTEFDGLNIPMEQSRQRFVESAELVTRALETGVAELSGQYIVQKRRDLRPRPDRSFKGRIYAGAISPESMDAVARLGLGMLVIPQKHWTTIERELSAYRKRFEEINREAAPPTIFAGWVYCHEDEHLAREGAERHIGAYYRSVLQHYDLAGTHFAGTAGYDYYGKMAQKISEVGFDESTRFFVDQQVWGTPAQCIQRIRENAARAQADTFIGVFSYGEMPMAETMRSYDLFTSEVMPAIRNP